MNLGGIIVGAVSFLIIGVFHPIVIKAEYYIGKKVWPIFLVAGVAILIATLWVSHPVWSPILGVTGCSCLWSIGELFEQEKRVQKGWFPKREEKGEAEKQAK